MFATQTNSFGWRRQDNLGKKQQKRCLTTNNHDNNYNIKVLKKMGKQRAKIPYINKKTAFVTQKKKGNKNTKKTAHYIYSYFGVILFIFLVH